jgi:hypothetical protein
MANPLDGGTPKMAKAFDHLVGLARKNGADIGAAIKSGDYGALVQAAQQSQDFGGPGDMEAVDMVARGLKLNGSWTNGRYAMDYGPNDRMTNNVDDRRFAKPKLSERRAGHLLAMDHINHRVLSEPRAYSGGSARKKIPYPDSDLEGPMPSEFYRPETQ